ncbi:MAG: SpoIIE family protein phosphatase [Peptococcaceae bacterium]
MQLVPEIGIAQLAKKGEELCGDAIEIRRTANHTIVVLSDGLGSGVKANILATLTAKIAAHMISQDVPVTEVVNTLIQTLPICKIRGLAYSTFTIIKINREGEGQLFEYDGPSLIKVRGNKAEIIPTVTKVIAERNIREGTFHLKGNELLVLVSDGVTQAGLGGILPLGLGIEGLMTNLEKYVNTNCNTQKIANQILELCESFYAQEPGDDTTIAVLRLRRAKNAVVLTGPPKDVADDLKVVEEFMAGDNVKIVCGGTTANIVARETKKNMQVDFSYVSSDIPPIAKIDGVDLVTEGILTLTKGLEMVEKNLLDYDSQDGSSLLVKELLECDKITFMVGTRINPAHQNPELPLPLGLRKSIVERWREQLAARGKIVDIHWY